MSLIEYSLLKHKSRCFNVETLQIDCDTLALTSSEEGVAILWSLANKKPLFTFKHNLEYEVLRSRFLDETADSVLTCGSDGIILVWNSNQDQESSHKRLKVAGNVVGVQSRRYSIKYRLNHDSAQIYACDSILKSFAGDIVVSVADNLLYLWSNLATSEPQKTILQFDPLANSAIFGGEARNAEGKVFIFDMQISPNQVHDSMKTSDAGESQVQELESRRTTVRLALAMSDCTVRIESISVQDIAMMQTNFEVSHICVIPLQPFIIGENGIGIDPEDAPMITAVNWRIDSKLLLASLGNGEISLIDPVKGIVRKCIRAHSSCCFGAKFCDTLESFTFSRFISWSRDGTIRLWQYVVSDVHVTTHLLNTINLDRFPIYGCSLMADGHLLIAGDGDRTSFLGVPVHVLRPNFVLMSS